MMRSINRVYVPLSKRRQLLCSWPQNWRLSLPPLLSRSFPVIVACLAVDRCGCRRSLYHHLTSNCPVANFCWFCVLGSYLVGSAGRCPTTVGATAPWQPSYALGTQSFLKPRRQGLYTSCATRGCHCQRISAPVRATAAAGECPRR
eukprot:SAG31_NODE_5430_length_2543_cov_1.662848_4_plen_146_part_00